MNEIKELFQIQDFLESINYPDHIRISKEILNFLHTKPTIYKDEIFRRLRNEEPWEYIRGTAEFCGNEFIVNRNVLIPRIETEQLVYDAISFIKSIDYPITLIDVGTGSGCIAISIAKECANISEIISTDISQEALDICKKNEEKILGKRRETRVRTNLIESIKPKHPAVITANLPYIPTNQYLKLDKSVKDYEPRLALDGGESVPDLYKNMYKQITFTTLRLFMETEESIIDEHLSVTKDYFKDYTVKKKSDLFGRDRFIYVESDSFIQPLLV